MTILNVVQPDEFHPSSFTVVDGELKVAISSKEGNILELKDDGLYAPTGSIVGVPARYSYKVDTNGIAVHKGIVFKLRTIDGAIAGDIYGVNPNDITPDDSIYYSDQQYGPMSDDEKLLLSLPWGSEFQQRSIIKLHRNGTPEIWVVRVLAVEGAFDVDSITAFNLVIDEMINIGGSMDGSDPGGDPSPGGSLDKPWFHLGLFSPANANGEFTSVIGLPSGDVAMTGHTDDQPDADKLISICALPPMSPGALPATATYGYCPVTGQQLYFDGINFIYRPNSTDSYQLSDLPVPGASSFSGVSFGNSAGEGVTAYTINETAVHYYLFTGSDPLTIPGQTIELPPGLTVLRYAVSGHIAYYLIAEDGNYVLRAINLETKEVSTTTLLPQASEDDIPVLLNTGLGGVIVYVDKMQMQVLSVVAPKVDMDTFIISTTLLDPQLLTFPLMFTEFLNHTTFNMVGTSLFKLFLEPDTMSFTRLSLDFLTGEFNIATTPIPSSYLEGFSATGQPAAILSASPTMVAYDYSDDGSLLTHAELTFTGVSTLYESVALLRFPAIGKTATLALSPGNTLSLFSSDFAGNIDTSVNYIDQEQPYAKTLNGLFVWDQNAHAAAWVSDNKRVYLARFDTTTIEPVITELGESINDRPWLEISHTSNGDVYLSEKLSNTGLAINVWKVDINNSEVVPYFKESIRDETATFEGEYLCGNRLVAFESPVGGNGLRFRAVSLETNESIVSSEVPHFVFASCLFANLTGNTFVVINKLLADGTWDSIGTRVLMVTINETEIIVKDTGVLPLLNARTLTKGPLNAGVGGDGSTVVNFYAGEDGVSYIFRIDDLNGEIGLSRQQVTSEMIQGAGIALQEGLPSVVFTSSNTVYIQHDLRLSSFKTFPLNMEKYDNSPKAVSLSATWNESYGMINVSGRLANTNPTTWTYAHLEVETPSGQIHTAKYRIGTTENGLVERNLWAIAEPGEYIFRLRPWDGGDTVEARAIVPSEGKDFRAPIVTPTGDGEWVFSTENTEAGERGVYNVYRSRHPVSIIEDFDRDGYVYDNIHTTLKKYSIPAEERNGVWYIIVGHSGVASETIWTPTFFTYGE